MASCRRRYAQLVGECSLSVCEYVAWVALNRIDCVVVIWSAKYCDTAGEALRDPGGANKDC